MNKFRYKCESCGHGEQEEFNICPICNKKEIADLNNRINILTSELFEAALQVEMAESNASLFQDAADRAIHHASDIENKLTLQIDILSALIKAGDLDTASLMVADWEAAQ
ncbi:hypothetical protein [Shewanella subflava]|uniref:Rubredoxin n=1 Tax=Shewanella subflava TaxID=2986476 RepID=A0ABT3ICG7_9GAMM|nr:hypothetical protein [Shewanella subflava]MCW3173761.1 hypothetical protein [Shewanella subflava]